MGSANVVAILSMADINTTIVFHATLKRTTTAVCRAYYHIGREE